MSGGRSSTCVLKDRLTFPPGMKLSIQTAARYRTLLVSPLASASHACRLSNLY